MFIFFKHGETGNLVSQFQCGNSRAAPATVSECSFANQATGLTIWEGANHSSQARRPASQLKPYVKASWTIPRGDGNQKLRFD